LDTLIEWVLHLPISPENFALIQLLRAGKIRDEREVIDGEEVVMFKSMGSIPDLSGFFRRSPSVESALVELFVQGGLDFSLSSHAGRPVIQWRINSNVADCVLSIMDPPNQLRN
jgi:hypothetical protein